MYQVSDAFNKAINSNTRNSYWTGTIRTNDAVYPFENKDIVKGSGYITRQCCGSSEIELGSVYASELGITLLSDVDRYTLDGATVELYFHLILDDDTEESIPMGIFEVTEANRNIKTLELKAYDYMLRFDKELSLNSSGGNAYNFLTLACNECKVELAHTQAELSKFPNGNEQLGIYTDNDLETYRDLIYYVAQVIGCVCQINREGKLQLIPYGNVPVAEVSNKQRFDSSYSDFVTRYTAVSSTNMNTEESEYYCLDPDDGLTLNLGVNPLLQFGLKETRKRIITNILNDIAIVNYVPFDSTTIGNPALDPMDCLIFSGGHADEGQMSCITSITYNINGKQSLKCVGKNPKLAAAKSKNDKNITGLINQIETGKVIVYNFVNATPYTIGSSQSEILSITFTSKEETSAMFLAEVLVDIAADEVIKLIDGYATYEENSEETTKEVKYSFTTKGNPEIKVIYKMNNEELETFYPQQITLEGKQIITLFLPITRVIENSENTLSVFLEISGGSGEIAEEHVRATISGQGLVAGIGKWDGRINISESIGMFDIDNIGLTYRSFNDNMMITFPSNSDSNFRDVIPTILLETEVFEYGAINERIGIAQVIKSFSMNETYPPEYDENIIVVDQDGSFYMKNNYTFNSSSASINYGILQELCINTESFDRVEKIEVRLE